MNELDAFDGLADRLHELGQRAPVPLVDPLLDIRRGRTALRRRHARNVAGIGTGLVAVSAVAAGIGGLGSPGGSTETILEPASSPSGSSSPTSTPTAGPGEQCVVGVTTDPSRLAGTKQGVFVSPSQFVDAERKLTRTPEVTAALAAYHDAAAAILDPSGAHLDSAENERSGNVQSGGSCDPKTGAYHLTALGTKIGWTAGGALGVVQIEVDAPHQDQQPQVVLGHDGWRPYEGQLPAGVRQARVTDYSEDGGGHAVVVERTDGLTVAVDTSGVWGNNVPPGSSSATDLPTVDDLLALAASPQLTLPKPMP
jgi:hypothetical protein